MENIKIEKVERGYIVKADTERFGKDEVMYEAPTKDDCIKYIVRTLSTLYRMTRKQRFLKALVDWMPENKLHRLRKACLRNAHLTGFYGLGLGHAFVDERDGLYIRLTGCRSNWVAYINRNGEFTNCPSKKEMEVIDIFYPDKVFAFMG